MVSPNPAEKFGRKDPAHLLVVLREPFEQVHWLARLLHLEPGRLVDKLFPVDGAEAVDARLPAVDLGVVRGRWWWCVCVDDDLGSVRVTEAVACDVEVLPDDEGLDGSKLESAERVLDSEAVLARVLCHLVEVLLDEPEGREQQSESLPSEGNGKSVLLLLDKLDVAERLGGEFDGLVETVLASVAHVNDLDDLGDETHVEHVALVELRLEVGASGENDALDVDLDNGLGVSLLPTPSWARKRTLSSVMKC